MYSLNRFTFKVATLVKHFIHIKCIVFLSKAVRYVKLRVAMVISDTCMTHITIPTYQRHGSMATSSFIDSTILI